MSNRSPLRHRDAGRRFNSATSASIPSAARLPLARARSGRVGVDGLPPELDAALSALQPYCRSSAAETALDALRETLVEHGDAERAAEADLAIALRHLEIYCRSARTADDFAALRAAFSGLLGGPLQ